MFSKAGIQAAYLLMTSTSNRPQAAARQGNTQRVQQQLTNRPRGINSPDINGFTALHTAAMNGLLTVVQMLIDNGCDVNTVTNDKLSTVTYVINRTL